MDKHEIIIEDGFKRKCPFCNTVYAIENNKEVLYRNISLVYLDKSKKLTVIKCKQCKQIVEIKT